MSLVFVVILGCFSEQILAAENEFQVELIIFSQNMPNTEVFDQSGSNIKWPGNLYEPSDYRKPDALTLTESYKALAANSAYQPLLHTAWVQKAEEGVLSGPVHIHSADGRINGFVMVQRSQSLQLQADLEYSPGADNSAGGLIYRLAESRQMKPDEVNYFDHPKFAVLAKITAK
ncbi:MAG: CsiV family protein [Methylococcales bacterium]